METLNFVCVPHMLYTAQAQLSPEMRFSASSLRSCREIKDRQTSTEMLVW